MTKDVPTDRFIIQVERPGETLDMGGAERLLRGSGVELDTDYGPIAINSSRGLYVVRGTASPEAREKAEAIPGIRFFADSRITKAGRGR